MCIYLKKLNKQRKLNASRAAAPKVRNEEINVNLIPKDTERRNISLNLELDKNLQEFAGIANSRHRAPEAE